MFPVHLLLGLQLENYQIGRFLYFAYTHFTFWYQGSQRQHLIRTKKAIGLFVVTVFFFVGIQVFSFFTFHLSWCFFGILLISILGYPLLMSVVRLLFIPFERGVIQWIILKTQQRVRSCSKTMIIGITGSYGKTSVKECLYTLLKDSFDVIAPEGTHNTLLGICHFILKHLKSTTQVMIVEMGAYIPGDIQALCEIVHPQMAILTGITLQHLERFKSLDRIVATKFEITKGLTKGDLLFVDGENEYIQTGLTRYCTNVPYDIVQISDLPVEYLPNFQGISFTFHDITYTTKLLGKHTAKNLSLAISVALQLGVSPSLLQKRVQSLPYVNHRLELLFNKKTGVYVLDDSFNGNIEGIKTTVDLLIHTPFSGKRLYLTPGLVELGAKAEEIHFTLGKLLASSVDELFLIKNANTLSLQQGAIEAGFDPLHLHLFETVQEAHKKIGTFAQKGDIIIFQNDLTDNY